MSNEELAKLIERQCDDFATGMQSLEFLRDDDGAEPTGRQLIRRNFEEFAKRHRKQVIVEVCTLMAAHYNRVKDDAREVGPAAQGLVTGFRSGLEWIRSHFGGE